MPFAATWIDLEIITLSEVRQTSIIFHHLYVESKKWYKGTYAQNRNRLTDIEKTKQSERAYVCRRGKEVRHKSGVQHQHTCVHACSVHSAVSTSLWPHGQWPTSLLCPQNFPGKNTWMDCHFLLQGIFSTQRSNPCLFCLLPWQAGSLAQSHQGSTRVTLLYKK